MAVCGTQMEDHPKIGQQQTHPKAKNHSNPPTPQSTWLTHNPPRYNHSTLNPCRRITRHLHLLRPSPIIPQPPMHNQPPPINLAITHPNSNNSLPINSLIPYLHHYPTKPLLLITTTLPPSHHLTTAAAGETRGWEQEVGSWVA